MKIQITTTVEKEITFPHYFKFPYSIGDTFYAILSEDKALRVDYEKEVSKTSPKALEDNFSNARYTESTREEFEKALNETVESIMKIAVS